MKRAFCFWLLFPLVLAAQNPPRGNLLPEDSFSPDGQLGFTIPTREAFGSEDKIRNSLIEIKTGRVLAEIAGATGWDHGNHDTVAPARWNKESTLVLWQIDGKWGSRSLVVLKLASGRVLWQSDVLQEAQTAILRATQKAAPEKYAAAKKANAGSGSAFPEGFTVDVQASGPVALPLRIKAFLTSNPKGIETHPNLDSHLEGVLNAEGKFEVTRFKLGDDPSHEW